MEFSKAAESSGEFSATANNTRKMSFGFSLSDERIKLIDILSEDDDDFLVASPFGEDSSFPGRTEQFGEQDLFRLSGFGCSLQGDYNPADAAERCRRPSYLRKSLAWDTAFFNSAGVLDQDELSLINKGFGAEGSLLPPAHCVRKRRPEVETTPEGVGENSSMDWFEIEPFEKRRPSTHKSRSGNVTCMSLDLGQTKQGLRNTQALKKLDESVQNKKKVHQNSMRNSISLHGEEMMKKEVNDVSGRHTLYSPRPPKASGRSANQSTRLKPLNRTDLPGKSSPCIGNESARTGTGPQRMVFEKDSASQRSSLKSSTISAPAPVPFCDKPLGTSSPRESSSTSKRRLDPRKNKLYASSSTFRGSDKKKGMGVVANHSTHSKSLMNEQSPSLLSSLSKKQRSNASASIASSLHSEEALHPRRKLHASLVLSPQSRGSKSFPRQQGPPASAESSSVHSLSADNSKQSNLRLPSARIGFFDEFRSLLAPTRKKLESGVSDTARKIRRPKTPQSSASISKPDEKLTAARKISDAKRPRNMVGLAHTEGEKRKDVLKNKRCRGTPEPVDATGFHSKDVNTVDKRSDDRNCKHILNGSMDQIGSLSRFFEAIALDQDKTKQLEQECLNVHSDSNKKKTGEIPVHSSAKQVNQPLNLPNPMAKPSPFSSVSSIRTPLADRSSVYNFSQTLSLPLEPKKEKFIHTTTQHTFLPNK